MARIRLRRSTRSREMTLELALVGAALWAGCNGASSGTATGSETAYAQAEGAATSTRPMLQGTTCEGIDGCGGDQVCVAHVCRARVTSVSGEIFAASAVSLAESGDWEGALRAYDESMAAYVASSAPVPPDLSCASAALLLRNARDAEGRERGAQRADRCFRDSPPGFGPRDDVRRALARLRFEGLDLALFDRPEPAERFFTVAPSRPSVDAVQVELRLPEPNNDQVGLAAVTEQLDGEVARHAVADCLLQDWEVRHERSAEAHLVIRFSTHLRDLGTYDAYDPQLVVEKTSSAEDGFEPCLAQALTAVLTPPRQSRVTAWQNTIDVAAHIQ